MIQFAINRIVLLFCSLPLMAPALARSQPRPSAGRSSGAAYNRSYPAVRSTAPSTKYVVAHFMVGNTYPYTQEDWTQDIELAHANGIDAFALNVGSDDWQRARVEDAYAVAGRSATGFKLFLSLDMAVRPCASVKDATDLRDWIASFASDPAQLRYRDRALLSTFSGSDCKFGSADVHAGWRSVLDGGPNVHFVPSFFVDPATLPDYASLVSGAFNWNGGWPIRLTSASQRRIGRPQSNTDLLSNALQALIGSFDSDKQYLEGLAKADPLSSEEKRDAPGSAGTYMAAVSPWFFTHYGKDTYDKNWLYVSDNHLYARRWETLIDARDSVDIVEIVTWNDYGESSYIGPIHGAQPKSNAWVDGLDHQGWLPLTRYYAEWFKTGAQPVVSEDSIVLWARPHSKGSSAPNDGVGRPTNWEMVSDTVWAVALLKAPGEVRLSTSAAEDGALNFKLPAGISKFSIPIRQGGQMRAEVVRDGAGVVRVASNNFTFQAGSVETYNFNVLVVASDKALA